MSGTGGGGGVVRARRQVWTVQAGNGAGEIDVVLGVNGFIWICKHSSVQEGKEGGGGKLSITRLEDGVREGMYENRNEVVEAATRREIARLTGCVRALVEGGVRVDEEMVMRAYEASLDESGAMREEDEDEGGEGVEYLGGERGRRVVAEALAAVSAARP